MTTYLTQFSGGKGSYGAAKLIQARLEPGDRHVLLFTDTLGEDEDLYRFMEDAVKDIQPDAFITAADGRTIWGVFRDERMIGNTRLSVCSRALKQRVARRWAEQNTDPADTVVVVGIDYTEAHRLPAVERNWAPWPVLAPLCEPGAPSKAAVDAMLDEAGVRPPALYAQGYEHNNCAGACVRAGQAQWARLLVTNRARYLKEEAEELAFRDFIGKDVSILRDRRRPSIMARLGLTDADVEKRDGAWYVKATGEPLPKLLPLPLALLRRRIESGDPLAVDWDDAGSGCGCNGLDMEADPTEDWGPAGPRPLLPLQPV